MMPESSMSAKILTTGLDETLVASRTAILSRQYETSTAKPDSVLGTLRSEHFDLLLVCYSTPHEQGTTIIRKAHEEFPHLCIVRLLAADSPRIDQPIAHKLVTVDYKPQSWIQAVDELLHPLKF